MTVGERIKARRKEIGMTADELAEKVGVSRSTVFRYENGYISKKPIENLVPIARALGTTLGYLMGWDDNTPDTDDGDEGEGEVMRLFDGYSAAKKAEALNYLRYLASHGDN